MKKKTGLLRRQLFHTLGLSCLAGAVFLQILVFTDIFHQGYFYAIENNQLILSLEVFLTIFTLIYFIYICQQLIRKPD